MGAPPARKGPDCEGCPDAPRCVTTAIISWLAILLQQVPPKPGNGDGATSSITKCLTEMEIGAEGGKGFSGLKATADVISVAGALRPQFGTNSLL